MSVYTWAWIGAVSVLVSTVSFVLGMAYQIRLHDDEEAERRARRNHPAGSAL